MHLTNVSLPDAITTVNGFNGCINLESIDLPNTITTVGAHAFEGSGLKSIKIPESVTQIEHQAFCDCGNLQSLKIPPFVTDIGHHAFAGCNSLQSLTIPSSVKKIGERAFYNCDNLTGFVSLSENPAGIILVNPDPECFMMWNSGQEKPWIPQFYMFHKAQRSYMLQLQVGNSLRISMKWT